MTNLKEFKKKVDEGRQRKREKEFKLIYKIDSYFRDELLNSMADVHLDVKKILKEFIKLLGEDLKEEMKWYYNRDRVNKTIDEVFDKRTGFKENGVEE